MKVNEIPELDGLVEQVLDEIEQRSVDVTAFFAGVVAFGGMMATHAFAKRKAKEEADD